MSPRIYLAHRSCTPAGAQIARARDHPFGLAARVLVVIGNAIFRRMYEIAGLTTIR
jgi:hypothetical protein